MRALLSWRSIASGLVLCGALAACSTVPDSGPATGDIEHGSATVSPAARYALIDLTPGTARTVQTFVAAQRRQGPIDLPAGRRPGLVGVADLLQIAIWEPNPTATSLTTEKSGISFATRVGTDGTIGVPYAGRLRAVGRSPAQIEQDIASRLATESPGAQVTVLVAQDMTNDVIVQGDVAKPGRYPVVPGSSGLLDVLAIAGGAHTPNHQTLVRITRGDTSVTRTLTQLIDSRAPEADLAPGDRILVLPRPASFYAFGAVNRPGEQPYDSDDLTLSHTLARLEGLSDSRADPAAVFIYRRQSATLTHQLLASVSGPAASHVIYRLNLRDPNGFFVGEAFPILPDDLIYVSNAPIAEAAKVFQILTGLGSMGSVPRNLGASY